MKKQVSEIYSRYGFRLQKEYPDDGVLVFTLEAGYFKNVDIVPISENANLDNAFKEFSEVGFACTKKTLKCPDDIERSLFDGFFSISSNRERLKRDYENFSKSIVSPFGDHAEYKYLKAPYYIDEKLGEGDLIREIISRINDDKPILFLIEAAAGFGKTCSAYELASKINEIQGKIPLFAELSKNRQARIFKYILLDEIDRTFPLLSSALVHHEIIRGNVVAVLDGFDELLRDGEDNSDFDNKEPMLDTIGEYLKGSAKIILTTRKTVLFEGDEFYRWVDNNQSEFSLVKIRIGEPQVNHWLEPDRLDKVKASSLDINDIANPVLLSYLRCIPELDFLRACDNPEEIVENYFIFMLERERVRQDLHLDVDEQSMVLKSIAKDMLEGQYKSEDRDYMVDLILRDNLIILEKSISRYPSATRPTKEEVANKLASHALLDRSSRSPNKIGFINDFALGNYVSQNVITSDDWLNDDWLFMEPAVLSFKARSESSRCLLWDKLKSSVEYLDSTKKIIASTILNRRIVFDVCEDFVESISLNDLVVGEYRVHQITFNDCDFNGCHFVLNNISEVTFLNCRFYGCNVSQMEGGGLIYLIQSQGDEVFIDQLKRSGRGGGVNVEGGENWGDGFSEKLVLEKFWPAGRDSITHKHRPIKGICASPGGASPSELYLAIERLKKRNILRVPQSPSFVEINFKEINEIRRILGRDYE